MAKLPSPDVPAEATSGAVSSVPHDLGTQSIAVGTMFTALLGWLPLVFAALPAIYYGILIYETKTMQRFRAWVCSFFRRKPAE